MVLPLTDLAAQASCNYLAIVSMFVSITLEQASSFLT